ncbi:hypothetical protein [Microbacterium plantarum]|uniref:hypothetical protein n=1 Tax=Microbacterium plantarum TaxID=1816425 RepID=UPI002B47FEEC|nr:hypothetical protein [Microbacterium plantarum]WRK16489.1 hypothetical protein VC184_11280 [Microbacterium plantarum]
MSEIVIAVIGGVFLLGGALVAYIGTRGKTQADAKTALDARIDARVETQLESAWEQIDELKTKVDNHDKKWGAVGRVFRAIDQQFGTPNLNPSDIVLIEDTIPPHWIRR